MSNSREMRRLQAKWQQNTGWPKRLDWIELDGIRGWAGQRVPFGFPIVAVVGENGSGKSTVLQGAASTYQPAGIASVKGWFASDFLPKTIWENVQNAEIRYAIREGERTRHGKIHKPGERWRGNPERPERSVAYIDLRRLQPIVGRTGYSKLAKDATKELSAESFDKARLSRFSQIMNRQFIGTRMVLTDADEKRIVPVFTDQGRTYSGYHAGAGQMTISEFLRIDPAQNSLLLIDEIETSLHPRAQRRLMRDLAEICCGHPVDIARRNPLAGYVRRMGNDLSEAGCGKTDCTGNCRLVVDIATGQVEAPPPASPRGRAGGLKGGAARAKALDPQIRREIARKGAASRWAKK